MKHGEETRAYDYKQSAGLAAEISGAAKVSGVKIPPRIRWAVYVYPDTVATVRELANRDRKTIGQYLDDLIAQQ